jgi:hypothetical protein
MFVTVALQTILNTQHAGMGMMYAICTRFHFLSSLFITVKPSGKKQARTAAVFLFYILQKLSLQNLHIHTPPPPFQILSPYIILEPHS